MDQINKYYAKVKQFDLTNEQKRSILERLKKIEGAVLDVITYAKTYEENKELYDFPAFFDKDNGILYAHQLRLKNNQSGFLLLIWKTGILNMEIMNYDLNAVASSRNYENIKQTCMQNNTSSELSNIEETKEVSDNKQEVSDTEETKDYVIGNK